MAQVVITLKIMPTGPDVNLDTIEQEAEALINDVGNIGKKEIEPVAFGLKAIKIFFIMDEDKGGTDELESKIAAIENVNSVDVVDVRRAVG